MSQIHILFGGLGRSDRIFISTALLRFRHAFPQGINQYGNHQTCEKDANESDQKGQQSSDWGFGNNIAVADGQPRDKGKVQRIIKRHLLNEGGRTRTGNHQSDQRQNDGFNMPDSTKEMRGETGKHYHPPRFC